MNFMLLEEIGGILKAGGGPSPKLDGLLSNNVGFHVWPRPCKSSVVILSYLSPLFSPENFLT